MFNLVVLTGRLTADPELKTTQSGISVTSFSIAVDRRYRSGEEKQTDFINIVAWRQQAEFVSRYFHKGSSICVVGTIQVRSWTDNQNQKRYSTEVIADEISFVDSKGDGSTGGSTPYTPENYTPSYSSQQEAAPKFEEMSNDDDLPF